VDSCPPTGHVIPSLIEREKPDFVIQEMAERAPHVNEF